MPARSGSRIPVPDTDKSMTTPDTRVPVNIEDEMKRSYLDYAMSVIIGRALPDVRDGLKPAHRRVLYAMRQMGLASNRAYRKCAKIVGEVIGNYHPHGDASAYDTLVRLAQDFNMRYPLVDPQGNFGSIDGDRAAAYRYTEARLEALAEALMADLDKDAVDFVPKVKLEVAVADDHLQSVVDTIIRTAQTGQIGDGKIFVTDLHDTIRIRTGETGGEAL